MSYDFTTRVDRRGQGSEKWKSMFEKKADVPEGVVPLSVADMELPDPPMVLEALHHLVDTAVLGYTGPTDSYYEAVLGWQRTRHNWNPERGWVVESPGVVPAFFNAAKALTKPGDGIIIQPPVYYPFSMALLRNGRTLVENPLRLEGTRYEMDFDDLEAKASDPDNKVLLFCSPHNPVGRVWSREELRRVVDICLAHDVFIISDEIHDDLILPGHEHVTLMNVMTPEEWGRCLICTAPSKTFNLAGCQCSNIFIPDEQVRKSFVEEFNKSAMGELTPFGYTACTAAYEKGAPWLDELLVLLETNRALIESTLAARCPSIGVIPLEGTYLQWLDLRYLGMGHEELEHAMQDANLFFDEGYIFGTGGDGFERINIACPTAVLAEALDRLVEAVQKLEQKN